MTIASTVRALVHGPAPRERMGLDEWARTIQDQTVAYGGARYLLQHTTYGPATEPADPWSGEIGAVVTNPVVYGLVRTRVDLFAQATFAWRRYSGGSRPTTADLFTDSRLAPLDNPAGTLEWCELDVSTAGNSFWVVDSGVLRRLPPQWCTIVLGSRRAPDDAAVAWDAEPIGLIYLPPGKQPEDAETFTWAEVAHYAPERDPQARWRGMSYLRPAMEDVRSDNSARRYVTKFFDHAATPNLAVVFDPATTLETIEAFRDKFLEKHSGVTQAFRTAFLGGGADIRTVGSSMKDLDSADVRREMHVAVAHAAGINPMAVGLMEVNYANVRESSRAISDRKIRYLWLRAVDAFRPLVGPAPAGATLWYDVSGVSALQADALDDAQVQAQQASTMVSLLNGGFEPDTVVSAVTTGDFTRLVHTGLVSVQLIPPGVGAAEPIGAPT